MRLPALISTLVLTCVLVPGASAASPWAPFAAADFTSPAGTRCAFTLSGHVLADQERIRMTATFPDGSPQQQQVVGRLVVRYVNDETGASVVRNLTGNALIERHADGSSAFVLKGGHLAVGLRPQDPGGPAFLVLTGHGFRVDFAADGTRTVTPGAGTVENICDTLA